MKIRQYTAATMQEARLKIKMDLGPDAVILHTRTFKKGGFMGLFGKDWVEVLAAVDSPDMGTYRLEHRVPEAAPPVSVTPPVPVAPPPPEPVAPLFTPPPVVAPPPAAPEPVPAPVAPPPELVPALGASAPPVTADLTPQVAELQDAVGEVRRLLGTVVQKLDHAPGPESSGPLAARQERMVASDLAPAHVQELLGALAPGAGSEEEVRALEELVAGWLPCSGPISIDRELTPKIVALVGPTGVGKTTTIAKLAATYRLLQQQDVALITIDTYRVAAVEQLKTYGDIIGIPVEVVVTPSALREAIARFAARDLILIDTAGRSPSNRMHLHELRGFLDFPHPREVHLVLSATTNRVNLDKAVEAFGPVGVDHVIFTKIDECCSFGAMVSTARALGKPVSYLTTGQSVPDDIKVAEAPSIARMLIDEWLQ